MKMAVLNLYDLYCLLLDVNYMHGLAVVLFSFSIPVCGDVGGR